MYDLIDNEEIAGLDIKANPDERLKNKLPRGYLSVSQVSQYMRCGEAYYFKYVLDKKTPSTYYQVQGRGVHKAAEKLHLRIIANESMTVDEMVSEYSDLYDKEIQEVTFDVMKEEDPATIKDAGVLLTRKYHRAALGMEIDPVTNLAYPPVKPIAAERILNVEIETCSGEKLPFMGVIDLEEEDAIADLKTKKKAASQLDADNSLQLSLYAHMTNKRKVRLDQLIKPTKRIPERFLRTEATRTEGEVAHAVDVVSEVADDIARGRFRKTSPENWWCSHHWCPYWFDCRGKLR